MVLVSTMLGAKQSQQHHRQEQQLQQQEAQQQQLQAISVAMEQLPQFNVAEITQNEKHTTLVDKTAVLADTTLTLPLLDSAEGFHGPSTITV